MTNWITNTSRHDINIWKERFDCPVVMGKPVETEKFTVSELEEKDFVGLYEKKENE